MDASSIPRTRNKILGISVMVAQEFLKLFVEVQIFNSQLWAISVVVNTTDFESVIAGAHPASSAYVLIIQLDRIKIF